MNNEKVKIAYRPNPFSLGHIDKVVIEGSSISQMIEEVGLSSIAEIHDGVFVYIGDELIDRARWDDVKLVRNSIVSVGITPAGGGGQGGKNPTRTIAMIAVMVVAIVATYGVAGWAAGAGYTAMQAGTMGAVAGAAVSMAGSMLVNALIPLASQNTKGENDGPNYLSGMSNRLDPYGPVPRLFGKNRVYPRYAAMPYTELVGTDEQYLRCLFCVGKGKYALSDFKIGETLLSEYSNVEKEEYFTGDSTNYRLFPNDPSETALTIQLLQNAAQTRTTGTNVDEIAIELTYPAGLYELKSNGNRKSNSSTVKFEYSVAGANQWRNYNTFKRIAFTTSPSLPSPDMAVGQTVVGPTGQGVIRNVNISGSQYNTEVYDGDGKAIWSWFYWMGSVDVEPTSGTFSSGQAVTVAGTYNATISTVTDLYTDIVGEYGSPVKKSLSVKVPRGQYDVRVTKLSVNSTDNSVCDVYWTTLRTITYQTPVNLAGCTLVALRIKATGQLNGMLDQFSCVYEALNNAYDGTGWNLVKTRNPAWAFAEVLCGNSNKRPVATTRLDLTTLRNFAARCEAAGFNFDAEVDYKTTAWELLRQICAAGRATPGMTDNKYTVIEDLVRSTPIQHFSPRNSWNFSGSRIFPDVPHALRVRFPNEAKDYIEDERVIYDDGYNEGNASMFETLDFFGVTNGDHVWKLGRYYLAVMRLRPEKYTFDTDVEHMVATRGDLVRLTHDVLMVGLAAARIKTISTTQISIDDVIAMEAGRSYGFQFRRADGTFKTCTITTSAGEKLAGTVLAISPAMAAGDLPAVGDMCFFGEAGSESNNVLISRIEPGPDLTARITCIPYNAAILTADGGTIPTWESGITLPPVVARTPPKPKIIAATYVYRTQNINADGTYELVMSVGFDAQSSGLVQTGTNDPAFQPPDVAQGFQAEFREDDGNWIAVPAIGREARSFEFPAKNTVSYDIRLRSYSIPGVFSDWDLLENVTTNYVAAVPGNVTGLQRVGGGTAFTTKDLEVEWTAVAGGGDTGSVVIDYKVEVYTSADVLLRTEYVPQPKYLYDFDKNGVDGGPLATIKIKVYARNRFNAISITAASITCVNPVPGNPQSLTVFSPMGSCEFNWAANTEVDFLHFLYRLKITSGGSWTSWAQTYTTHVSRALTPAEKDSYGADAAIYFEVKAVDAFNQESGSTAIDGTAGSLNIKSTDISTFAITASKMFTKIPVIEGLSLTNNSPASGRFAWSACSLYYNGVLYSISSGNVPLSTHIFVYWKDLASTFSTSITHPADLSDWKPGEDFIIAVNKDGVGQEAWNAIANQVIGSAFIMNAAIQDAHVANLSGTKISASSSIAIGPGTTYGTDGIQLEYNSGNPRFYAGNGAGKHIKFDGTDVEIAGKVAVVTGSSGYANFSDKPSLGSLAALNSVAASNCDTTIISGGKIITGLLTASNITTGTMNAERITAGTITADRIVTGSLTYTQLGNNAVGYLLVNNAYGSGGTAVPQVGPMVRVGGDEAFLVVASAKGGVGAGNADSGCSVGTATLSLQHYMSAWTDVGYQMIVYGCQTAGSLSNTWISRPGGTGDIYFRCSAVFASAAYAAISVAQIRR